MFDFRGDGIGAQQVDFSGWFASGTFRQPTLKTVFDWIGAVILLPLLVCVAIVLLALNPFFNKGSLFFVQDRMGHNCHTFKALKFRTMFCENVGERGAFDQLEVERITPLGHWIRRMRIDELPQVINVLRGEMSLIGPRPDCHDHAQVYLDAVPGYRARLSVMPGISGFAQTEVGYVDGLEGVQRKVAADLYYISHASLGFDLWIAWRTIGVVLMRQGA